MTLLPDTLFATGPGASSGDPQLDPEASLSGFDSSTSISDFKSTLTGIDGNLPKSIFTDSTEIGSSHVGKWILFRTGNNDNDAREIVGFNTSIGEFTVDADLSNDSVIGDDYELFTSNGVFSAFSPTQAVNLTFRQRLFWVSNQGGGTLNPYGNYVVDIDPGPLVCEIVQGLQNGAKFDVVGIVGESDEFTLTTLTDDDFFVQGAVNKKERYGRPPNFALAQFQSPFSATLFFANTNMIMFVKLSFRRNEPIPLFHRCVFQIFYDDNSGTKSSTLIVVDVGADEVITTGPDRTPRYKGGCRVQAIIKDSILAKPIPGKTVTIKLVSGPGSLTSVVDQEVSDTSGNPVQAVYLSPTVEPMTPEVVTFSVEVS